jgi:ribokinase
MRIIVVGSANQDYLVRVPRAPRAGETVMASGLTKQPGGKGANQAVAAARLGGDVSFVGAVGRDDDGASILRALGQEGVSIDDVRIVDSQPTGLALVSVDEAGENSITVVSGANATTSADEAAAAVTRLATSPAIVVLQGELPSAVIESSVRAAAAAGARAVVNLAPYREVAADVRALADPLVLNESEAGSLLGSSLSDLRAALGALDVLLAGSRSVVITLGAHGAVWASGAARGHEKAVKADDVVDTTGAGDAFVGSLAFALADGRELGEAVRLGTLGGSFAIRGVGAQKSYARPADLGL